MKAIEKVYQMSMFDFERAVYGLYSQSDFMDHDPEYYVDHNYFFFLSDSSMAYGSKDGNLDLFLEFSSSFPYLMTAKVFLGAIAQMYHLVDIHSSDLSDVHKDYYIRWNSSFVEVGFLSDNWSLKYRGL